MESLGRKNSGRPTDIAVLEQLEETLGDKYFDATIIISANNVRWLIHRAGLWVRRENVGSDDG